MQYRFKNVRGHIEVYGARGEFLFSADNEAEARAIREVRRMFMDCELKAMGKLSVQCMEVK